MNLTLDDQDGLPVADYHGGEPLPSGDLTWEALGVGHRCQTFLGWSASRCCPVVVKFPRPHQRSDPRARTSLQRETAALQQNSHPALPDLYVDGTQAPIPFVVTEYVDGPTLADQLDTSGAFEPGDVALLGVQVLSALTALHARDLAHVDIKPDNVVLRDGRPVLLDFGSARRFGAPQPSGTLIGSPGYAAPELESGAPIDPAMDLYGVGLTLREALSGTPVFDPDLTAADRPELPALPADGAGLGALLDGLTAVDPADRPSLGDAFARSWAICRALDRPVGPDWLADHAVPGRSSTG